MDLFEVMFNCRAMRRLKPDPVPEPTLLRLVEAGNQAPSASNMQLTRWIIVREPAVRERMAELNRKAVLGYLDKQRPLIADLPHQSAAKRTRMMDAVAWQAEHLQEMPALIVACMLFADEPNDMQRAHGGGSVWPAVQNLLLAARALGLGAAPTTLGLTDRASVKATLAMPANLEAYCLIPVGYPLGKFGPVSRLPVSETVRFDRWGCA